ncbi:hypothetical protein MNEG_13758 [Monoraphidium neglectum]|uniref:Uncharacterized protein n=1 Tax=Monoraphidium neglectum TaxID=145388 RepID=A0A0D2KEI1_9CHLO|nr:hypothetical protein MNEG_13758 [Monoraphidium neglectum]KIY94203.1 hypothetical protein MNEG_13758 [Monoraphidium neglectum]|eukprot:XP_013893223.1 hypothetical protein MNEG_13758 [Monoraphidium neglectum]
MLNDIKKPKTRTLSFAAGLAPLLVESEEPACAKGVFRTSALIAATPHSPTDQKRNTDCSAGRSGGGGSGGGEGCGGIPPPPVLRFESWRHERGRRVGLALHFHVATSELAVRSDDGLEVTVVVYGASGHELEAHDLHVGAALRVLGCPITLRKADPRTAEWLEAEAALLRGHKRRLEEALSAFAPIVRGCGLECDSCGGQGHGHSGGGGCAPTHAHAGPGGAVNLRRLRDDIALLAGRLRQHKSKVPLPPELQSLVGEVAAAVAAAAATAAAAEAAEAAPEAAAETAVAAAAPPP